MPLHTRVELGFLKTFFRGLHLWLTAQAIAGNTDSECETRFCYHNKDLGWLIVIVTSNVVLRSTSSVLLQKPLIS